MMIIQFLRFITLVLLFCLNGLISNAQVFWSENFTANGAGWALNTIKGIEGTDPNYFAVNDDEGGGITPNLGAPNSCGVANNNNNCMYITSVAQFASGASYDAGGLCGILFCPLTNRQSESPVINCTGKSSITLNFNYIEFGDGLLDNATLWYYNGTTWSQLDDMPKTLTGCGGQGLWASRMITLPASANNNANVKIAFRWVNNDDGLGTDPSFAVDDINLSTTTTSPTVTTIANIAPQGKCACDTLAVSFTSTGSYVMNNIYTAQLSDATGSFANPTAIGNITSSANAGIIACTIPCNTMLGTGYRVRVIASNPNTTGANNGANFVINPQVTPSVSITKSPTTAVCAGTFITFTAVTINGGIAPTYQWKKNGVNIGTNSSVFSSATLSNNDVITCVVTSNAPCSLTPNATSNSLTALVNPLPVIAITSTPTNGIVCNGGAVTLCASGGLSYVWTGGITNCTAFLPMSNAIYTITATNSFSCLATATTNVVVNPSPILSIVVTAPNPICADEPITLCASGANSYVWTGGIVNCNSFITNNSTTYTVTGTSTNGCTAITSTTIVVQNTLSSSVSISSIPAQPFLGNSATFTAIILPTGITNYQLRWYKGNSLIAVNNNPTTTFTTTITNTTDSVYAVLVPLGYCGPDSVSSKKIGATRPESLENINTFGISVYPNPTSDNFVIDGIKEKDELQLIDGIGKMLFSTINHYQTSIKINMHYYANGIYFLKVKRNGIEGIMKISKIK